MNKLTIQKMNDKLVTDSRDVSDVVDVRHDVMLKKIRGYIEIMEKFTDHKIVASNFFIENTYTDSTGRELPCYLLTKKGCDMVANKMTGEKGVLFTAMYVTHGLV